MPDPTPLNEADLSNLRTIISWWLASKDGKEDWVKTAEELYEKLGHVRDRIKIK